MDKLMLFIDLIIVNGPELVAFVLAILGAAEIIVRLTPTKKDDGFVERVGKTIRKAIDLLDKIFPNLKRGGGKHEKLKDKEAREKVE